MNIEDRISLEAFNLIHELIEATAVNSYQAGDYQKVIDRKAEAYNKLAVFIIKLEDKIEALKDAVINHMGD